tara:strand:- start:88 stop:852 length:765 start_codon:yes stop_codon:yes gene_type:complete
MPNIIELKKSDRWPLKEAPDTYYTGLKHWYDKESLDRIDKNLLHITKLSNGNNFLDISYGNPFLLERVLLFANNCKGHYIDKSRANFDMLNNIIITEGGYNEVPYLSESFDVVASYAFLHIIPDLKAYFEESYRLLKEGGTLYTDGDRNIQLLKIIRLVNLFKYKYIFRSKKGELNHWRNLFASTASFHVKGIRDKEIKELLYSAGFKKVTLTFWFTSNHKYVNNFIFKLIIKLLKITHLDSFFFTHIMINAEK